jgi:hypothetical protein
MFAFGIACNYYTQFSEHVNISLRNLQQNLAYNVSYNIRLHHGNGQVNEGATLNAANEVSYVRYMLSKNPLKGCPSENHLALRIFLVSYFITRWHHDILMP